MNHVFRPGDRVREKGKNSPEMMVEGYDTSGKVICSFWKGVSRMQKSFSEDALEIILPDQP